MLETAGENDAAETLNQALARRRTVIALTIAEHVHRASTARCARFIRGVECLSW